jgi:hypothetical protein
VETQPAKKVSTPPGEDHHGSDGGDIDREANQNRSAITALPSIIAADLFHPSVLPGLRW